MALALGIPVGELQARMSSAEFTEWMAFWQLEPWGDYRADLRSAIVSATIANAHRGKNQRPFKVEDFMPKFGPPEPKDPEEVWAKIEAWARAAGAPPPETTEKGG